MANIRGIELASETYDLEDTSARTTASNANAKATENETAISELQSDVETLTDDALTPKQLAVTQITLAEGYSADSVVIQSLVQVGKVIKGEISITNLSGPNIGTSTTAHIGTCQFRPIDTSFAIGFDINSSSIIHASIEPTGRVAFNESVNVPGGNNIIRIPITLIV